MVPNPFGAKIKVIGVGGAGGNAINTMIKSNLEGVEFICANTDIQSLKLSLAPTKIQLGKELTKGLGAGADPDIGRDSALEDRHELQEILADADMVFIAAGMGGGTGTGGASVIAQIAKEIGALTVAVVTKPFGFEGNRRRKHAELGIARMRETVDTLITIPNQKLLQIATPDLTMMDAFKLADNILLNAVRGISDIINTPGLINVDFADVKAVMSCMGHALMGIGYAEGENRAALAAKQAVASPLLDDIDIEGATGILINLSASSSLSMMEVNEACSIVQEAAHEDANIIFGAVIDESLGAGVRITVIATGFPNDDQPSPSNFRSPKESFISLNKSSSGLRGHGSPSFNLYGNLLRTETPKLNHPPPPLPKAEPQRETRATQSAQKPYTMETSFQMEAQRLAKWTFEESDRKTESAETSTPATEPEIFQKTAGSLVFSENLNTELTSPFMVQSEEIMDLFSSSQTSLGEKPSQEDHSLENAKKNLEFPNVIPSVNVAPVDSSVAAEEDPMRKALEEALDFSSSPENLNIGKSYFVGLQPQNEDEERHRLDIPAFMRNGPGPELALGLEDKFPKA